MLSKVKAWVALSRPPFLMVGILPFIAGSLLSFHITRQFNVSVFLFGLGVVIFVMLATYFNGEVHDIKEDRLSAKLEKNAFSAGTQVLVSGRISPFDVDRVSYALIAAAVLVLLLLQFYYQTGPWTFPLGITGVITGFYYSKPPFRWVQRGVGEAFIGYSYGWLTVAVGAYLQSGHIDLLIHLVALPIICTVFNVILINEFPDYPADIQVNKRNLVVRLGKVKCAFVYAAAALMGTGLFYLSLTQGLSKITGVFYVPFAVLSGMAALMMVTGKYNDRQSLERMCLMTYLVNLGTSLSYIAGLILFR